VRIELLLETVDRIFEHGDHQAMLAVHHCLLAQRPEVLRRQHRVGRELSCVLVIHCDGSSWLCHPLDRSFL
jgi:hypothetical protein